MTKHQILAAWMVFALIVLNLFLTDQWGSLWGVFSAGTSAAGPSRQGDTIGNPPVTVKPVKGKCPPGYDRQSDGTCRLHSKLPL
jgi:hypothetical protein